MLDNEPGHAPAADLGDAAGAAGAVPVTVSPARGEDGDALPGVGGAGLVGHRVTMTDDVEGVVTQVEPPRLGMADGGYVVHVRPDVGDVRAVDLPRIFYATLVAMADSAHR